MTELSLHILDIVQNSLKADSTHIEIHICIDRRDNGADFLRIAVSDNGKGMSDGEIKNAFSPISRIKRGVRGGFGLSLLEDAAERAGGNVEIASKTGQGTTVKADFLLASPDRLPLGDIKATIRLIITANTDINTVFVYEVFGESFSLSTAEIADRVGYEYLNSSEVSKFIEQYISEHISALNHKYSLKGI